MHNKLRRDLADMTTQLGAQSQLGQLLGRALVALGGPVSDVRPEGVTVGEGLPVEVPEPAWPASTHVPNPGDGFGPTYV